MVQESTAEPHVRMHEIESTNVEAIGFYLDSDMAKRAVAVDYGESLDGVPADEVTGTMHIRFTGGRTYEYQDVPAFVYVLIANAPSVGSMVQRLKTGRHMETYHLV